MTILFIFKMKKKTKESIFILVVTEITVVHYSGTMFMVTLDFEINGN